ncbi:MAG: hypothetical protein ABR607_11335 [Pyrinomonadaceae bacterium]
MDVGTVVVMVADTAAEVELNAAAMQTQTGKRNPAAPQSFNHEKAFAAVVSLVCKKALA